MKRIYLTVSIISLVFGCLFCGCGFLGKRECFFDVNNVKSVQIISLDTYVENEYKFDYTVLCEITDTPTFIEKLNGLKQTINRGEPSQIKTGYTVIRIDYMKGEYDLIYHNAQWFHRNGINQNGYIFFDKEQFNALILDYHKPENGTMS